MGGLTGGSSHGRSVACLPHVRSSYLHIPDQLVLLEAGGEALREQEQNDADSEGGSHRNHHDLRN